MPKTIEIDYYANEDVAKGVPIRYHVRTARVELADGEGEDRLPFLLAEKVGKHHGIRRALEVK